MSEIHVPVSIRGGSYGTARFSSRAAAARR